MRYGHSLEDPCGGFTIYNDKFHVKINVFKYIILSSNDKFKTYKIGKISIGKYLK